MSLCRNPLTTSLSVGFANWTIPPLPEIAEELSLKEKDADEVRRILIDELNRTFVTPFDREDIFALSRSIDDVMDYADSTVSEIASPGAQINQGARSSSNLACPPIRLPA